MLFTDGTEYRVVHCVTISSWFFSQTKNTLAGISCTPPSDFCLRVFRSSEWVIVRVLIALFTGCDPWFMGYALVLTFLNWRARQKLWAMYRIRVSVYSPQLPAFIHHTTSVCANFRFYLTGGLLRSERRLFVLKCWMLIKKSFTSVSSSQFFLPWAVCEREWRWGTEELRILKNCHSQISWLCPLWGSL